MIDIRKSFSSKLSLTVLLLAVPIFLVSMGLLFTQSRRMIREEAMGRAKSVLNTSMLRMQRNINTIETATNANYRHIASHLHPDSLKELTRFIVILNSNIDGCSISMEPDFFPECGRHFSAYTIRERREKSNAGEHMPVGAGESDTIITVVEKPYNYFEKAWYKIPRNLDTPCWVDYFDEADTLEVALSGMLASYGQPIHAHDGRLAGILSVDVSLTRLSQVISQEKPYPNSYFMMVDTVGHYIVHPDTSRLFTHTIFDGLDSHRQADVIALGHELTSGKEGMMLLDLDGVPSLVTYQPVPGIAWRLALVCPYSDIMENYHQQTFILLPLLVVGLMFILLLCHHAVAQSIRPLNALVEKTRSIASGNMEVYIPSTTRTDAVGSLQNSFASMLRWLNFHMGSVRYTTSLAQQRYEELAEATRLAEEAGRQKTAFIQNVSHQIRTPLNIIMGFAQILSPSHLTSVSEAEMAGINSTLAHNAALLNRMLLMLYDSSDTGFVEELNSNRHDSVACNGVARQSIENISQHYPGINVQFHTEVADDFTIQTNSLYLMQSLRELLYNAVKYSDGKHVSLSVLHDEALTVRFVVEDTGKGIAEEDLERMFAFFAKADDLSEGLGLGLPLAKRHILNLGGDLTLDRDYRAGCRFVVELPIA